MVLAILDDTLGTRFTGQPFLVCEFQPLQTGVVDVGHADDMRTHFSRGVITPVLALQVDTGYPQVFHLPGQHGTDMPPQVDELAVGATGQQALYLVPVHQ